MLDKLIISTDEAGDVGKRKGILVTTFMVVLSLFTMGMIYSLFSQNLAMGQDNLNITTLIAPPTIPQQKPLPPEPKRPKTQLDKKAVSKVITRTQNIQRMSETPRAVPKTISTQKSKALARPDAPYRLGGTDTPISEIASSNDGPNVERGENNSPRIINGNDSGASKTTAVKTVVKKDLPKPPPLVKKKKKNITVSKGVLNGKAKRLVMPKYPPAARAMGLQGQVTIQVVINENGKVISASSVKGHKLLTSSALRAARASSFTPTFLGDQKVKVRGMIVYNFAK